MAKEKTKYLSKSYSIIFAAIDELQEIWYGMLSGVSLQCCLLLIMVCRANWEAEVRIS